MLTLKCIVIIFIADGTVRKDTEDNKFDGHVG